MAISLFAKRMTHEAMREYRFVVLNGGAGDETVLLRISGMMRDALRLADGGLIRPTPAPADMIGEDGLALPRGLKGSTTPRYERATVKQRTEEREESRWETRNPGWTGDFLRRQTAGKCQGKYRHAGNRPGRPRISGLATG